MKERVNKSNKRIIPIEIKAILIIVILLFVGLLTTYILKSYAKFEKKESHNIVNAKVGNFGKEFTYTGGAQEYTVPITGYYDIELWGAGRNNGTFSLGGYTHGKIYLIKDEKLYVYVGEQGQAENSNCALTAWNGGGGRGAVGNYCGFGGSGATDIRLVNGTWNNSTSLRSRIMVAGGAGGASSSGYLNTSYGGSLIGGKGVINLSLYDMHAGNGGTQRFGGLAPTQYSPATTINGTAGIFGNGGNGGRNVLATAGGGGSSGGGGYYGGSGASGISTGSFGGGGGSSYISGYAGVDSVQESGGTAAQPLHTNNTIHYSGKYFINGKMQTGVNTGNGKAKIRYVRNAEPLRVNTKLNNVRYIKSCLKGNNYAGHDYNQWVELQAIKDGINLAKGKAIINPTNPQHPSYLYSYITDGIITEDYEYAMSGISGQYECITVDLGNTYDLDELVVWEYFGGNWIYYNNNLSVGATNVSGTGNLASILHSYTGTSGYAENSQGRRYNAWNLEAVE